MTSSTRQLRRRPLVHHRRSRGERTCEKSGTRTGTSHLCSDHRTQRDPQKLQPGGEDDGQARNHRGCGSKGDLVHRLQSSGGQHPHAGRNTRKRHRADALRPATARARRRRVGIPVTRCCRADTAPSALLFEVSPLDTLTFAAVSAVMMSMGLIAIYLPARRASAVDPVRSLRAE
jgi:hypothetical protein